MNKYFIIIALSLANTHANENLPTPPTTIAVAELLGVSPSSITRNVATPANNAVIIPHASWIASYSISERYELTIAISPHGHVAYGSEIAELAKRSGLYYQRVESRGGDIIHFSQSVRPTDNTIHITSLQNYEIDWDLHARIRIIRSEKADPNPFEIDRDGVRLIRDIDAILRK
jgi:hypothetical protein